MLFSSLTFLLIFLPVTVVLHLAVQRWLPGLRRPFLIVATLMFYLAAGVKFTAMLLASIAFNFVVVRVIARASDRQRGLILAVGVVANLLFLGYFKYANFFLSIADSVTGATFLLRAIVLPLGISFFTFQQIGSLIDYSRGRFAAPSLLQYAGFVLFFPQLLAGPITRYEEVEPQLRTVPPRGLMGSNILVGLALFSLGLFKKAVLADTLGMYAGPVFEGAAHGAPALLPAWLAMFAYTAQIYFDFAGYSDMAIGTARMLGVVLPPNFHGPLRAVSITELWRRWHMTLGRWVQSYIFQPLSMPLARTAANVAPGKWGSFAIGVAVPSFLSMLVIGIWHGAGWTFVLFGALQGLYMVVNEAWRLYRRKARKKAPPPSRLAVLGYTALTQLAFALAVVPFRSPTIAAAGTFYAGMAGAGAAVGDVAGQWPIGWPGFIAMLVLAYAIAWFLPTTQQFLDRAVPVLDWRKWRETALPLVPIRWSPTLGWTVALSAVLFLGFIFTMRGTAQFIYFGF